MFIRKFPSTIFSSPSFAQLIPLRQSKLISYQCSGSNASDLACAIFSLYTDVKVVGQEGVPHTHAFHLLSHSNCESVSQIVRIRPILSRVILWQYITTA